MRAWTALFAAIALEVTGTLSLKLFAFDQGQLPLTFLLLAGSYWLLAQAFRQIPVAVAFAVWEATGLLLITLLGAALLHRGTREADA